MRCGAACRDVPREFSCCVKHILQRYRSEPHLSLAAPATCRVCPREGFHGPADESLLDPAQAAHCSPIEAPATDSNSTQALAGVSEGVRAVTAAGCSEAELDGNNRASTPEGSGAASSTWEFDLPALPVHYINRVEDLRDVPAGDLYVQPPMDFAAIDSIAIIGGTAYLVQFALDVKHDINVGLLSVLACLPSHLEVRFVWALPAEVWEQSTFNRKPIPQIASLSQPVHIDKAHIRKHVNTAAGSLIAGYEGVEKRTAAEAQMYAASKQAIEQLMDRDVALVGRRVAACKTQFKVSIPVTRDAPHTVPQPRMQDRPQATLKAASSMVGSAASAVQGSRLVRFLPSASPCSSQSSTLDIQAFYRSAEGLQRLCR